MTTEPVQVYYTGHGYMQMKYGLKECFLFFKFNPLSLL